MIRKRRFKWIFVSVLFSLIVPQAAVAKESCLLQDVFVFGASLSAGYGKLSDAVWGKGSNQTPAQVLMENFYPQGHYSNQHTKITGGWYYEDTQNLLSSRRTVEQMKSSSLIISMDAFYWDAIDGEASLTEDHTCSQSIAQMEAVVSFAKETGLVNNSSIPYAHELTSISLLSAKMKSSM